jgi:hypothetical protein
MVPAPATVPENVGLAMVGDVENTKLVDVVPVAPLAVNPVMLLKQVMLAEEQFVPPLATARTVPDQLALLIVTPDARAPLAIPVAGGKPVAFVRVPLDGVPRTPPLTTKAPAVPTLTPRAVKTLAPVVVVDGAAPAPPPIMSALAASNPLDESVVVAEK